MMKNVSVLLAILGILSAAISATSCRNSNSAQAEPIVVGTMANAGDTLIFIAEERGYFRDNNLDVTLKTFNNGLLATNAMLAGEADLAYATEFVVVGKALQRLDISIVGTYSKNETVSLIGRIDQGIKALPDLKGKKIGLARGTITEFYLGRLLTLNGIGIDEVILVDINVTGLGDALGSGEVDAAVAGSRNLYSVVQQLGSSVFTWQAHSGQPAFGTLAGSSDWVTRNPELVKRFLKALAEAERFVNRSPDEARKTVQAELDYDDEYMASVWSEYQFSLTLDQALITAMEDEARWMIENNLTTEKTVPDFLEYIREDALKAVKPEAVNVIR